MEKISIKDVLDVINLLIKPNKLEESSDLTELLKHNLKKVSELQSSYLCELPQLKTNFNLKWDADDDIDISWLYVCTCLEVLLVLKNHLQRNESELLSVSQQKSVQNLFQFVVSMGLLPYLLPGVGLGIDQRCPNSSVFKDLFNSMSITDVKKYYRLCIITRGLLSLTEEKSISSLFLSKHMEDIFAALCQLTIPQFKQPTPELISDREYFQLNFSNLMSTSYQPLVINALMVLQGNKESPRWLRLGVSKLLTQRLIEKGGVLCLIRAIQQTADYENPTVVTRLESIARLVVTPHMKDKNLYYNMIIPQILDLLQADANVLRIGVLCCRVLYERDKDAFKEHISSVITAPLHNFSQSYSENEITRSINCLHKCFAIPGGDVWSVPVQALTPLSKIIYTLYCKICDSVLVIKTPVEELLWFLLSKSNDEWLGKIFRSLLLNEVVDGIEELPENISFTFGDEGGIKIKIGDVDIDDKIEYSKCILKLLEEKDSSGKISKTLFLMLLNYCSTLSNEISEMKLYVTELLADLAETEQVQKNISADSKSIINFIETLINNTLKFGGSETELLCIALVLLMTIMNDMRCKNNFDWSELKNLSVLLPKLSLQTKSVELKMLCDEVHNIISSQGIGNSAPFKNDGSCKTSKDGKKKKSVFTKSKCEVALEGACDPLLPVRGHSIIELGKLISEGDSEAKAKKNAILCIFQENLKNEDSYLYLSAIEGMASLAAEFPDTVLVTLTEEYSRTETTVRLKVGESLMRVVRHLGDMVPVYKNELLNSFLSGVRDSDNLVRASSLSNAGELCQLLGFRIGPIAAEILNCVESVVATDPAPEPRRAAVMLLTLILRGLHSDALNVLEPVLVPLYRTLKKIYQTDKDDVVKLHAQLAIEELNTATRSFLFPSENVANRIFVIDSPP